MMTRKKVDKYKIPIFSYIPEQHFSNQQLQIPSLQSLITMDFVPYSLVEQVETRICDETIHVGEMVTLNQQGHLEKASVHTSNIVGIALSNGNVGDIVYVEFSPSLNLEYTNMTPNQIWIEREQNGDAPHSLAESVWREQYRKPKPIQWDMLKILDHKCWKCQHWKENESHLFSWLCELQHYQEYDAWTNENKFPVLVYFSKIKKDRIVEREGFILINNSMVNSYAETIDLNDCPCYTESQEYHKWKEQQAFLKVKGSQISL